jgi:23S rRNA pseudouridine2605 synthase
MAEERLQKILAHAGIASRRKAEELIREGRVSVNGETVTELGTKADPDTDEIRVDGSVLRPPRRHIYIAMNKPREVVTTLSDPQGRTTVKHLLKGLRERVFPVGRLDYHSEGLLLLTNDGELANRILSPSGHVEKVYHVKVNGRLAQEQIEQFRTGISLHGRRTAPAGIRLLKDAANPWYEVRLTEGRQQQIRLMFKNLGRLVEKLRRVQIGPLALGSLPPGAWRQLTEDEVRRLRRAAGMEAPHKTAAPPKRPRSGRQRDGR